ncbi:phosphotransferase [Streptomyces durbertensis]|uniref:Phosphotransferase n=1 Tax=Streptomyces durbertensis TaxID=2448886 RepID=A0ABR6EAZ3_9ACTN|nr:aminoglycoside phosphotransferase family protein [Streptomyces durbertensis]MBB1242512.1 phosphotransferase [Streptomyces durbertensis]
MRNRTPDEVPHRCRQRLLAHYGPDAERWLDGAPGLLKEAADRWRLSLADYHDIGHASVITVATDLDGRPLLLKAWPDPIRYRREMSALRLWARGPTAGVIESADDLAVAALELVGGRAGGAERPEREIPMVAAALHGLHTVGRRRRRQASGFPLLTDHLGEEMLPRMRRRAQQLDTSPWRPLVDAGLAVLSELEPDASRATVLHADLYRENVLFDRAICTRFIDPLPMAGDAVYDWAFWTVYYTLGQGTDSRLAMASRISRIPVPELAPWCRALALDGLLSYLESDDPRAQEMAGVLGSLSAHGGGADSTSRPSSSPGDPSSSGAVEGPAVATVGPVIHPPETKDPRHA